MSFQAIALYSYQSSQEGDLNFAKGDVIEVTERDGDWWYGHVEGQETIGMFPSNYVRKVDQVKSVSDMQEVRQDTTVLKPDEEPPKFPKFKAYWAQEGPKVVFIVLYAVANLVMFFLTFEKYRSSDKKAPIFNVLGYGVVIARACGAALRLNCMLLLVCVLRNQLTWLRSTVLAQYLPLDKNIVFHKNIAMVTAFLAILHSCAHYVNLVNFSKTELGTLGGALENSGGTVPDALTKMALEDPTQRVNVHFFAYSLLPGWTGHLLLLTMLLIYAGTFKKVRRTNFEVFWYSHHFFILFYGLLCAHGFAELLEPAQFWMWGVGPMTLYALERIIRFWRSRQTTTVELVRKHPSGVLEVQMRKRAMRYNAGMYLWLNAPHISYWEWHPFTISSAPQDAYVSVHIKAAGDWTRALNRLLNPNDEKEVVLGAAANPSGKPLLSIDGPYGTGAQEFTKYDVLMLVGAGIGVTPFSSILKAVGCNLQRPPTNSKLKKVYFYWIMRDRSGFEWFSEMLSGLESVNEHGVLEIHNYLTGALKPEQIKDIMFAAQGPDPVTGLRNPTHYGRPNWDSIFKEKARQHKGQTIGVFFCGPRGLSKKLYATSREHTDVLTKTKFAYHKENF